MGLFHLWLHCICDCSLEGITSSTSVCWVGGGGGIYVIFKLKNHRMKTKSARNTKGILSVTTMFKESSFSLDS